MADISITTAKHVTSGTNPTRLQSIVLGATVNDGQMVYKDSNGVAQLADANVSATEADWLGMAMSSGVADQKIFVATEGDVDVGAVLVQGRTYWISATAGSINDASAAGEYVSIVGVAISTSVLRLKKNASGVTKTS